MIFCASLQGHLKHGRIGTGGGGGGGGGNAPPPLWTEYIACYIARIVLHKKFLMEFLALQLS